MAQRPDMAAAAMPPAPLGRIRVALFLAGFATFSLLYCVQPLLPEFAREFGVDAATSSLPLSAATACLALAIFAAAAVSESVGRRGLMFASIALAALLNLAAAWMHHWPGLVALRALSGIALGGVPAVALVYLAEELPPQRLGTATGLYVAGNAFGGMSGRLGMGLLADHLGWRVALGAISAAGLLAALGFVLLLPPSRHFVRQLRFRPRDHLRAWHGQLRDRHMRRLFAIPFLAMGVFVSIYNYVTFRLLSPDYHLSHSQIGLIFGAYVFGMVGSSAAGAAANRFGRGRVLLAGVGVAMAGVLLTALQPLAAVVAGIVLLTLGFFVAHSAASAWVARLGGATRSHAASLYLLAYYAGSSLIGALSGYVWQHGGWWALAAWSLALLGVAAGVANALRLHAPDAAATAAGAPSLPAGE